MHFLESNLSKKDTISKIDNSIITYEIQRLNMFGFVGKVNYENNTFWIVNHSNIYRSRSGYRYKTYRRFEGFIRGRRDSSVIEGEFKIRPLHRVMLIIQMIVFLSIAIVGGVFAVDIFDKLKLISFSAFMILFSIGIVRFNIHKTKESDEEILEFIKDIVI